MHAVLHQSRKNSLECRLVHLFRAINGVIAINQNLRLYDRNESTLLTECCIARERLSIRVYAGARRNALSDSDHSAPFGKPSAQLPIFFHPTAEAIQSLRHNLTREERQVDRSLVHLYAGDDSLLREHLSKRSPITRRGAKRLIKHDHAADCLLDTLGRKQQLAICAAVFIIRGKLDAVKAPLNRPHTFIGRKYALAFCYKRPGNRLEFLFIHRARTSFFFVEWLILHPAMSVASQFRR